MSTQGVTFNQSHINRVDSEDYHQGKLTHGFKLDTIRNIHPSIRPIFNENKPSRSIQMDTVEDLEIGNLIDISYKRASNSVNTPYRVADLYKDEGYNDRFDAVEVEFKLLLEPVIQNASLVVLTGFEREYDDYSMFVIENVYYKRKWDTPHIDNLDEKDYSSKFWDLGFEEKDRQVNRISILFDEVIAKTVGVEEKLVPVII